MEFQSLVGRESTNLVSVGSENSHGSGDKLNDLSRCSHLSNSRRAVDFREKD